jgi:hypothetical protein
MIISLTLTLGCYVSDMIQHLKSRIVKEAAIAALDILYGQLKTGNLSLSLFDKVNILFTSFNVNYQNVSLSQTHCFSLTLSHSLPPCLILSLSLSLSLFLTLSLSHLLFNSLSFSLSLL